MLPEPAAFSAIRWQHKRFCQVCGKLYIWKEMTIQQICRKRRKVICIKLNASEIQQISKRNTGTSSHTSCLQRFIVCGRNVFQASVVPTRNVFVWGKSFHTTDVVSLLSHDINLVWKSPKKCKIFQQEYWTRRLQRQAVDILLSRPDTTEIFSPVKINGLDWHLSICLANFQQCAERSPEKVSETNWSSGPREHSRGGKGVAICTFHTPMCDKTRRTDLHKVNN